MLTSERYAAIAEQVAEACKQAGRNPEEVTIVAVSKTVGPAEVASAIEGGARDFGENRPDQLMVKADQFTDSTWHFIGNIQSRRIRDIVGRATLIHSLFEERHARKIDDVAREHGIVQDALIEVNVSGEHSKSGLAPADVRAMLDYCGGLQNLRICGLMTMAPLGDMQAARQAFEGLRELRDSLQSDYPDVRELSMGMTDDWPIAIEEGATIVRIGRAIFSDL
ncbi:MAG: YggS family pyridoxal phosphate-dependent enzyme [Eggerthellaceae bacterium]|nr:YggS family pyridoxal phosphate-dependent enzyme [Eggerthellaceae bacterium]